MARVSVPSQTFCWKWKKKKNKIIVINEPHAPAVSNQRSVSQSQHDHTPSKDKIRITCSEQKCIHPQVDDPRISIWSKDTDYLVSTWFRRPQGSHRTLTSLGILYYRVLWSSKINYKSFRNFLSYILLLHWELSNPCRILHFRLKRTCTRVYAIMCMYTWTHCTCTLHMNVLM